MQLKTLIDYLKYSGIWINIVVNPFHWKLDLSLLHPDDLNPKMLGLYISIGPINVRAVLDDGSW